MNALSKENSIRVAVVVLALVAALGATMWYLQPERGVLWAVSMFLIPALWGGVMLLKRVLPCAWADGDDQLIHRAIVLAGVVMAVPLATKLATALQWIDGGSEHVSERLMGVTLGIVFVVTSNEIPKRLTPLSATRCEPTRTQRLQRFAGWTFVLAGLGYAIAWLVVPFDHVGVVSTAVLASGVVLVLARVAWALIRPHPPAPADPSGG